MRRTLPLGNSQNKRRKFKPCHQEEHTRFWFWLKGIAGWDLRLAQPQRFFVLVKGDRKMGSQVSPITQRILALVKTKFEKKRKKKERI
jgi:hypothetical protein